MVWFVKYLIPTQNCNEWKYNTKVCSLCEIMIVRLEANTILHAQCQLKLKNCCYYCNGLR